MPSFLVCILVLRVFPALHVGPVFPKHVSLPWDSVFPLPTRVQVSPPFCFPLPPVSPSLLHPTARWAHLPGSVTHPKFKVKTKPGDCGDGSVVLSARSSSTRPELFCTEILKPKTGIAPFGFLFCFDLVSLK